MRRVLGSLVLFTLASAPPPLGAQALVGMYPAGVVVDSGARATVPLVVDAGAVTLGSYQLQLNWNPAVLRYVGAGPGVFGAPTVNASNAAAGSLTLAGANPGGATGLFSVAELTFEMRVGTGSSPVSVVSPELTAVGTFAGVPATSTPGEVCTSSGDFGDVNRDGSILSNDALLVVTAAVGLSIAPFTLVNGDVDADGDADTRDALGILSAAVGLPSFSRVGLLNAPCAGAAAASFALTPGAATLAAGDVLPIAAHVFDAAGDPTSAIGLAWGTDAPGVATVDSTGRVTAVGNGSATITAMALGVPDQTVTVTVQDRHTWYVDAVAAAALSVHLGSAAYPFADIQPALDAAAPRDTVLVAVAPAGYGAASITKAVTIVGDSGAAGMPRLRNSVGAALVSNAAGTVTLRRLALEESNAGLDARGDTLVVQSVAAATLRGPAFRIHRMQTATLTGVSVNAAVLAGIFADSTGNVRVNGAVVRLIGARNDSAVAVAVVAGDSARVTGLTAFGVDNGSAVIFAKLTRGVLDGFDVRQANGLKADSVRSMILARGQVQGGGDSSAVALHADTIVVDTVIVDGVDRGMQLTPMARDTFIQPSAVATLTRSAIRNVGFDVGLRAERFGRLAISRTTVTNVAQANGIDVRRVTDVQIDSSVVTGVANGIAVSVDPVGTLSMRGGKARGKLGGLFVDGVQTVSIVGLEVDSSAIPPQFCVACAAGWGVRIVHADSVRLDSLNVHDNGGGGILVDSARAVAGRGSVVARNQGFGGSGGLECEPGGCQSKQGFSPLRPALTHAQFSQNNVPGVVLNLVQQARLAHFVVDSNANGGLLILPDVNQAHNTVIDSTFFRGPSRLVANTANYPPLAGEMTIRGSTFRNTSLAIEANSLQRLFLLGSSFDSVGGYFNQALWAYTMGDVMVHDDTVTNGTGWAFSIDGARWADVRGNLARHQVQYSGGVQEAVFDLANVDSAVVYGNRLEGNVVRGIIVRGSGAGAVTIDNNVVADDSGFAALQLHRPATVTRNLFARNANGVYVDDQGGTSIVNNNNFEGNVFDAVRNLTPDTLNAQSNWWNDALGPRCPVFLGVCNPASLGDAITGYVDFSGFLTNRTLSGAPLAVPPIRTARSAVNR